MKLIHLITPSGSSGVHVPEVRRWTGTEWMKPLPILFRRTVEGENAAGKGHRTFYSANEHSYITLDGNAESTYVVQTNYGSDGTTFLDGLGGYLTRAEGLTRIGAGGAALEVVIPYREKTFWDHMD